MPEVRTATEGWGGDPLHTDFQTDRGRETPTAAVKAVSIDVGRPLGSAADTWGVTPSSPRRRKTALARLKRGTLHPYWATAAEAAEILGVTPRQQCSVAPGGAGHRPNRRAPLLSVSGGALSHETYKSAVHDGRRSW